MINRTLVEVASGTTVALVAVVGVIASAVRSVNSRFSKNEERIAKAENEHIECSTKVSLELAHLKEGQQRQEDMLTFLVRWARNGGGNRNDKPGDDH